MNQNKKPSDAINLLKQEQQSPSAPKGTKGKRIFALLIIILFILSCGAGVGFRFLYHMYKTLPSPKELCNIQPSLVSKVLAYDSSLVHEFSIERRFWIPLKNIPVELQRAVIAIEDRRFNKHWGIDFKRIIGAMVVNFVRGRYAQGASTITQQLARNVYLTSRQSLIRKIREAITAVQIESYYTKDEILELYLNMVYLGAGVYGVETASQRYFSKPANALTLNECAVMAGIIQLPERYRPDRKKNAKRVTHRRNTVIKAMRKMGFITKDVASLVMQDTIPTNPQEPVSKRAPYFVEMVRQYMEKKYGEYKLYNGGLTICTTLDPVAQDSTDKAVAFHLDSLQRRTNRLFLDSTRAYQALNISKIHYLDNFDSIYTAHKEEYKDLPDSLRLRIVHASVVALDIKTGAIRVLTGGRDFSESKFNRAIQARRQPGSAFKPFVYTVAIDSGYTPATMVLDQPITLDTPEGTWRPENYDHEFLGPVSVRDALKKSINLVAIQVLQDIGAENVITYARKAGLKHRMNPVPALAIGACEITNLEITSAYSIYPNYGNQAKPYCIDKIYDRNGRLLEEHEPEIKQVLSPQTAYIMTSMLTSVVTSGTGASIGRRGFMRPAGGKTGTTNDYSDAWFVGFTPQIACGAWVGVDERRSMGRGVTGAKGALPIWAKAMKALHRNIKAKGFGQPSGIISARVCNKEHKIATRYCPDVSIEIFKADHELDTCDVHVLRKSTNKRDIRRRFGTDKGKPSGKTRKRKLIF